MFNSMKQLKNCFDIKDIKIFTRPNNKYFDLLNNYNGDECSFLESLPKNINGKSIIYISNSENSWITRYTSDNKATDALNNIYKEVENLFGSVFDDEISIAVSEIKFFKFLKNNYDIICDCRYPH